MIGKRTLLLIKKNLTYLRKSVHRLTLEDVASRVPLSKDTLSKIENNLEGDNPIYPSLKTLLMLAEFYNVDFGKFVALDLEMEDIHREEMLHNIERMESVNVGDITN